MGKLLNELHAILNAETTEDFFTAICEHPDSNFIEMNTDFFHWEFSCYSFQKFHLVIIIDLDNDFTILSTLDEEKSKSYFKGAVKKLTPILTN